MAKYLDCDPLIEEMSGYKYGGEDFDDGIDTAISVCAVFPPADVRPVVRGKWKITPIYIKCLECGECFMLIPQNFCPNCGADMRETEE